MIDNSLLNKLDDLSERIDEAVRLIKAYDIAAKRLLDAWTSGYATLSSDGELAMAVEQLYRTYKRDGEGA